MISHLKGVFYLFSQFFEFLLCDLLLCSCRLLYCLWSWLDAILLQEQLSSKSTPASSLIPLWRLVGCLFLEPCFVLHCCVPAHLKSSLLLQLLICPIPMPSLVQVCFTGRSLAFLLSVGAGKWLASLLLYCWLQCTNPLVPLVLVSNPPPSCFPASQTPFLCISF